MRHTAVFILQAVNLFFISQVSGLNLDKVKRVSSASLTKRLGDSNRDSCKNIKCQTEERVCAKLRTKIEFSSLIMVINKCELEYMKCNEGMEAIELPMKYCRKKEALDNARKAPLMHSNRWPYKNENIARKIRSNRRSKRSPEIATKIPHNNLTPKLPRKSLGGNKPRLNYNSLYFGPRSRKDADADNSLEGENQKEENTNRNQDVGDDALAPEYRQKISLALPSDHVNRYVQSSNQDGDVREESPQRNDEINSAETADNGKIIALTLQTNPNRGVQDDDGGSTKELANRDQEIDSGDEDGENVGANRDLDISQSARPDNANRDVQILNDQSVPSKESINKDQEIDPDNKAENGDRQKIHLVIGTNSNVQGSEENDDQPNEAPELESLKDIQNNDDEGAEDDGKNGIVVMIDPSQGNKETEDDNDGDVDGPQEGENAREIAVSEEDQQSAKPKAVDEGDDEDENARDETLEKENEIDGETGNKEGLKDDGEENNDNDGNTGAVIENPGGAGVNVIIDNGAAGDTLDGNEEGPDQNDASRLEGDVPEDTVNSATDEMPDRQEQKGNSVEQASSLEGDNTQPDYEDVNIDEYKSDCPSVCPARDVMVCARCKEGVYRTFMSICHLRMFNCKHPEEKLELVGRSPCMMSAPFLNDMPKAQGRVGEPGDKDKVFEYLRCKGKSALKDPKCKRHAVNEEAQERRYKI